MRALDRKLLRDARLLWSQAVTVALVVAAGVAGFLATLGAVGSLAHARDDYYAQAHFAEVFASATRAPDALAARLRTAPGVADVQTTVERTVRVSLPGVSDPILGHLIGIDPARPQRMNRVTLREGRMPAARRAMSGGVGGANPASTSAAGADAALEALVSAGFADARGLRPGAQLTALIAGKRRMLRVVGVALSPEYVFAGLAGMPDMRGFGVFWVDRTALAAASDMQGAFDRVAVKLAPGARREATIAALDRMLAPWGGRAAHGREDQPSHAMLDNEIREQRVLGTVLPSIFFAVAAFLLNVVISRLVATQREQIAALKALGYADRSIAWHYLRLVLGIVIVGLVLGIVVGDRLAALLTGLYADFFHFPRFEHRLSPGLVMIASAIALAAGVLGTLGAIAASVRLAPAEAMRPPAPGRYRPALAERLGLHALPPGLRMTLRGMERRPLRSALSVAGVAAAVAIVVMGNFFRDAIDAIVDAEFNLKMRADTIVWTAEPLGEEAAQRLARLPGVRAVESGRDVAVRLAHGHRSERATLQGYAAVPTLLRIVDVDGRSHAPPDDGLLMTDRLADKLSLRVGDAVRVEVLDGRPLVLAVPLRATVRDSMGLNVYIERRALNRLLQEGVLSNRHALSVAAGQEDAMLRAAAELPAVTGAFSKATLWRNMRDVSARNVRIMSLVLTAFATVIAVGVVYNNARIALAERGWELASLRVLGFGRGEASALLLGEIAIGIALALPMGMWLGHALVRTIVELMRSDQFYFPVDIQPRTYALAALAVLAAGLASALVVRRRIDRLDLVAALKTRE